MAAQKSNLGLHITLIFSAMITLIAVVVAWMSISETSETAAKLAESEEAKNTAVSEARQRGEQLDHIKQKLGHDYPEIGTPDSEDPNTVLGAMNAAIIQTGQNLQRDTYHETLVALRQQLDDVNRQLAQAQIIKTSAELARDQQNQQWQTDIAIRDATIQANSEEYRADNERLNESLQTQATELANQRTQILQQTAALQQARTDLEGAAEQYDTDRGQYQTTVARLRSQLDEVQRVSFEVPDGMIRWVDHVTGLVWVNVGEADNLKRGTTFSVYTQDHHGVGRGPEQAGRGPEDIKGQIEVTRVISPHLSEGRILEGADIFRPITPGDPIYTPLWTAGTREGFAFVGIMDLTGDGVSDRDMLHNLVEGVGAEITAEVDDQGIRHGDEELGPDTKWLILGALPDPGEVRPDAIQAAEQIVKVEYPKIREEALRKGIRIVTLDDFLAYIGYRPTQRLWRPGEEWPYTLESGSQ
ncbi:MAG: hypothetical protein ACREIV_06895, partial [Planctomycetaceae bacterium]